MWILAQFHSFYDLKKCFDIAIEQPFCSTSIGKAQHEQPSIPVVAYEGESVLGIKLSDKTVQHALLEITLKPGMVIIDHLGLATQLVLDIGANDNAEAIT